MIPKLHKKGTSFRGAATYLLHDKEATTTARIDWTQTRNLATDNAQAAWRVMAATAMDQARLKAEAGVKNTGRKSRDHVLHFTISWHPDEAKQLSREEMIRAANGAIRALKAEEHQALLVSHNDEPQPHVHVLLNRVSPTDGRLLSSSKEKLALSAWAEQYERERGTILCEERVLNNARRARGQYTRAAKEKPRHIHELEASNDNHPDAQKVREVQRRKDRELRKSAIAQARRHQQERDDLYAQHGARKREIIEASRRQVTVAKQAAADGFSDAWRQLHHEQEAERTAFAIREGTHIGRATNALRQVDWAGLLRKERRGAELKKAFGLLSSSGARAEELRRAQQLQTLELERREKAAQREAAERVKRELAAQLQRQRIHFEISRKDAEFRHKLEDAALRTQWRERRKQRQKAWEVLREKDRPQAYEPSGRQSTAIDPQQKAIMDDFEKRIRQQLEGRGKDSHGRDDDRGR